MRLPLKRTVDRVGKDGFKRFAVLAVHGVMIAQCASMWLSPLSGLGEAGMNDIGAITPRIQVIRPHLHHAFALGQVFGAIVGAA